MISFFQKAWTVISMILLLAIVLSLFFFPEISRRISVASLVSSLGMAIFLLVCRQMQYHRTGQIDHVAMFRDISIEVIGLLFAVALAALIARWLMAILKLPSMGWIGIVMVIIVSASVGLSARWLVKITWGRLIRQKVDNL